MGATAVVDYSHNFVVTDEDIVRDLGQTPDKAGKRHVPELIAIVNSLVASGNTVHSSFFPEILEILIIPEILPLLTNPTFLRGKLGYRYFFPLFPIGNLLFSEIKIKFLSDFCTYLGKNLTLNKDKLVELKAIS